MTTHLATIISAIKEFDARDFILDHARLEVKIPSGFFRFDETTQHPNKEWDPPQEAIEAYQAAAVAAQSCGRRDIEADSSRLIAGIFNDFEIYKINDRRQQARCGWDRTCRTRADHHHFRR